MKKLITLLIGLLILTNGFCATSKVFGVREVGDALEGIIADLEVEISQGSGRVFIDTTPLTEIDTQASARLAREVACETMNTDCSNYDFFYVIRGEFPMIGGPSAGAAMTVLTMSELAGLTPNSNVAMTGTVNPDGSVGSIGGVVEKAITASDNGITTFLIPQGQLIEFGNYSFDNMRIVEVSTVREAYGYFTNNFFAELDDTIYYEEFNNFMQPMSEELMNYSNNLYNTFQETYNSNNYDNEDNQIIQIIINSSITQTNEMNELYENNSFYSAASYAVGTSINNLYATYLVNYFMNNETIYIQDLLYFLNNDLNTMQESLNQTFIVNHINDLEAINIAIDRYFEATQLYSQALTNFENEEYASCLYNIAFTYVRLETSKTWLNLIDDFNDHLYIEFNQNLLQELSLNRIEGAETMITYAESIDNSFYTISANQHLTTSIQAYDEGNYIYSLFESLKALSNANLAMQLRGISIEQVSDRIELSKTQARQNINIVQNNNLMPILALSYYEYAQTFETDSPAQALIFLEYSKQFSLLTYQMVSNIDASIFQESFFEISTPEEIGFQILLTIIGFIIGFFVTISIMLRLIK